MRRNFVSSRPAFAAFSLAVVLALGVGQPAMAQTAPPPMPESADDVLRALLDNQCAGLFQDGGDPTGALGTFCGAPPYSISSTAGSGGASVQSSATSVRNSLIQLRTDRAREAKDTVASYLDNYDRSSSTILAMPASDGTATDSRAKRFDVFASLGYENLDRTTTSLEDGYDSNIGTLAVGADYRFNSKILAGAVVALSQQDGDFNAGGNYEMDSLDPTLFVAFLPSPEMYVQVVVGQRDQEFDTDRFVDFTADFSGGGTQTLTGIASSQTDSKVLNGGASLGYDFSAGKFTFGPRLAANYSRTKVDAFSESGGSGLDLNIAEQTVKSLQAAAGFYGSAAFSTGAGVFLPQFGVEYVHEFEDNRDLVTASLVDDTVQTPFTFNVNEPDTGFVNVEAGVSAVLPHGIQPFLSVRAMFGNDLFDNVAAVAGVRFEL